jgi:putative phosphoribosyl transferase
MQTDRESTMFTGRGAAGKILAERLRPLVGTDPVVLGLTRGGVPVAFEVARALAAPLDVVVVSRLVVPWQPELAMGAVAEGGVRIVDNRLVEAATVSPQDVDVVGRQEEIRLRERVEHLRAGQPPHLLGGRTVVVVDDGIDTGSSIRAACQAARNGGAARIVVAVPVSSPEGLRSVSTVADEVVALKVPADFLGVGRWYLDFCETEDEEVAAFLRAAESARAPVVTVRPASPVRSQELLLTAGSATLAGRLSVPMGARELVIVAHDSSRQRCSSRSRFLSRRLTDSGLATLLVDLLTLEEETHGNRFLAIDLLADRLQAVTRTFEADFDRIDYLADGVAAAVALAAAALPDAHLHAVACLGGRPELVARLGAVQAPVLFIVGEADSSVLRVSQQALLKLTCPHRLAVIPAAGPAFSEPGALPSASDELCAWFGARVLSAHRPALC